MDVSLLVSIFSDKSNVELISNAVYEVADNRRNELMDKDHPPSPSEKKLLSRLVRRYTNLGSKLEDALRPNRDPDLDPT